MCSLYLLTNPIKKINSFERGIVFGQQSLEHMGKGFNYPVCLWVRIRLFWNYFVLFLWYLHIIIGIYLPIIIIRDKLKTYSWYDQQIQTKRILHSSLYFSEARLENFPNAVNARILASVGARSCGPKKQKSLKIELEPLG